jgi:hypothetical protein
MGDLCRFGRCSRLSLASLQSDCDGSYLVDIENVCYRVAGVDICASVALRHQPDFDPILHYIRDIASEIFGKTMFARRLTPRQLGVADYARQEVRAREKLSNDHIRAFSPVTFALHGYPAVAESDAGIVRFVDTMQELNDPVLHHKVELYTPEEAAAVRSVNEVVLAQTRAAFGRAIRPWMGPLAAIKLFRAVQEITKCSGRKSLRIFEVGPGSGYLGALLLTQGHEYWSTDIAQGFYLWQSRLMRSMSAGKFVEGAFEDDWPYRVSAPVVHVPWWHFATLYRGNPPSMDVLVCDHTLGEMHPYALRYASQMARMMLEKSSVGFVVYSSIGEPRFNTEEAVRLNFERVELTRAINGKLTLFSLPQRAVAPQILALAEQIPLFNPSGAPSRLKGQDFVPIRPEEAPLSYEFYQFLGYDVPSSGF